MQSSRSMFRRSISGGPAGRDASPVKPADVRTTDATRPCAMLANSAPVHRCGHKLPEVPGSARRQPAAGQRPPDGRMATPMAAAVVIVRPRDAWQERVR